MAWLKRFFRTSRWLHKYVGLLLIVYGVLMGVSGILVNHPEWISGLSMPRWLVPEQYQPKGFDRGTLGELIFLEGQAEVAYLAGTEGVWQTADGGLTFEPMLDGFPEAPAGRVTHDLLLQQQGAGKLWAGTDAGLYVCDLELGRWSHVPLGEQRHSVRSILDVRGELVAFTPSSIWRAADAGDFQRLHSVRQVEPGGQGERIALIRLFFELHSGAILGLLGQLLFDMVGLAIIFISISAFYIWYYPWRRRAGPRGTEGRGLFKLLFRYHLKIGIWITPIALLMAGTGFFMRPPLLVLPATTHIPTAAYPGLAPTQEWTERIHRAVHDAARSRILVEAQDGFWAVPDDDLEAPFEAVDLPLPIHVMGSTVLDVHGAGLIVGSFSGGYKWSEDGSVHDLATGQIATDISTMRLAEHTVTGIFSTPTGERFLSTFHTGIVPLDGAQANGRFRMPVQMSERYRMSLWNGMFELHNGRFFRDWIGKLYMLVPILGSLLFGLLTLTGLYDWLMVRVIVPRRRTPGK